MLSVTFDIDWAPDWAIGLCADICKSAGVGATFFITHQTDVLQDLKAHGFELGVHPNFLPGSSHGSSVRQVIDNVISLSPESKCLRSHALVQSSPIMKEIEDNTNIDTDVSILLPFHKNLTPTKIYFSNGGRGLTRLPYYWEDDIASYWPGWSWASTPETPTGEMRIYDFHPIHVALNMASMADYERLKESLNGRPLGSMGAAERARFTNPGEGARSYLERLVRSADPCRFLSISEISRSYGSGACVSPS